MEQVTNVHCQRRVAPLRTEDGPFPESGLKTPEYLDWNQKVRMCLAVNVVQVGDGASSSRTDGFRWIISVLLKEKLTYVASIEGPVADGWLTCSASS